MLSGRSRGSPSRVSLRPRSTLLGKAFPVEVCAPPPSSRLSAFVPSVSFSRILLYQQTARLRLAGFCRSDYPPLTRFRATRSPALPTVLIQKPTNFLAMMNIMFDACPDSAPFFGFMGIATAVVFASASRFFSLLTHLHVGRKTLLCAHPPVPVGHSVAQKFIQPPSPSSLCLIYHLQTLALRTALPSPASVCRPWVS